MQRKLKLYGETYIFFIIVNLHFEIEKRGSQNVLKKLCFDNSMHFFFYLKIVWKETKI